MIYIENIKYISNDRKPFSYQWYPSYEGQLELTGENILSGINLVPEDFIVETDFSN